jgi:chromosome partitioning protein
VKLAVVNLKGGVAKTTTAVHLALLLASQGRTLLVDADPEQSSALAWSEAAEEWPPECTVIPWATRDLARRVRAVEADYEHVVLDVSPKSPLLARQAMSVADGCLLPVSPSPMEVIDLADTLALADEVGVPAWVLLVKVRAGTRSAAGVREMLRDQQMPTLTAEVGLSERYVMAYGMVPMPTPLDTYPAVLSEVKTLIKGGVPS